ncbi:MAG: hypothetical protein ACFNUP_07300, partial [Leptotrichia hofstadii]
MIQEKIRYTKTGKRIEVYEFKAKLHQKVVMSKNQFEEHIFPKHPEISLEIIKEGGAYVNNQRISSEDWEPTADDLLYGT